MTMTLTGSGASVVLPGAVGTAGLAAGAVIRALGSTPPVLITQYSQSRGSHNEFH